MLAINSKIRCLEKCALNRPLIKGILLMLGSSLLTCTGQLLWKLANLREPHLLFLAGGFLLYGLGALCMMLALRCGELSVLHPMLSFGFIVSIFLGAAVLGEAITLTKTIGIILIIFGMIFLGRGGSARREQKL